MAKKMVVPVDGVIVVQIEAMLDGPPPVDRHVVQHLPQMQLTLRDAKTLYRLRHGLIKRKATFRNSSDQPREVQSANDAMRWLLQQAEAIDDPA